MDCIFSAPKQIDEDLNIVDPYNSERDFQYSEMNCTTTSSVVPDFYETITDETSGKSFVLDKSISYGSALTSLLILFMIILLIGNFLFKTVIKRN